MNPLKPDYKLADVLIDGVTTSLEGVAGTTSSQPLMLALCYVAGSIIGTARRGYLIGAGADNAAAAAYEQLFRDAFEAGMRGIEPIGPLPTPATPAVLS